MERGAKVSLVFLDACRNNTLLRDLEQSLPQQSQTLAANRGPALAPLPPPPAVRLTEDTEFVRALQTELKRVGCLAANVDGKWGEQSKVAFQSYVKFAKLDATLSDPQHEHLVNATQTRDRVCPLVCDTNESAIKGACVPNAVDATTAKTPNKPADKIVRGPAPQSIPQKSAGTCGSQLGFGGGCPDFMWWYNSPCTDAGGRHCRLVGPPDRRKCD